MKRFQIFLAGAFIATGSLFAQSDNAEWQAGLVKMKELIPTDPTQASDEAGRLLKGKNKKNPELVVAVARAFLDAGKLSEAEEYLTLAKKADNKSAAVSVLEGDIALAQKDAGRACQMYEQAIYFDSKNEQAYLKLADIYKGANPQQAIEKLEQLKSVVPSSVLADKKLAEVYYMNNHFDKASEAYARFIHSSETTEDDLVKYAFALFLNHDFEKSLEVVNLGLKRNVRHAAFNRLAMYNYTDLKRYDDAQRAADAFFNAADKVDYSYLDYMYYGHLLNALKKYDEAVMQYLKAIALDTTQTELWREISNAYEQKNDYTDAIAAYQKYYEALPTDEQTADLQFQMGKLYYGKGTQSDTLAVGLDERKAALVSADSIFAVIAQTAPDSYLGNFWRARANSALDPETTQGLAKPYYEEVAALLVNKNDPRYNSVLVECYSYLGYYYLVANKLPESKEYWNRILAIDPANATAKRALDGIK
jgi:tetratricopeptide (TPR) repeat protein